MPRSALKSLTLYDYSDRELLFIIDEAIGTAGTCTSEQVSEALGMSGDRPNQAVGSRLSWMAGTYGVLEVSHKKSGKARWSITPEGRWFMEASLSQAQQRLIDGADPGKMLLIVRRLADGYRSGEVSTRHMTRREWMRGTDKRRIEK